MLNKRRTQSKAGFALSFLDACRYFRQRIPTEPLSRTKLGGLPSLDFPLKRHPEGKLANHQGKHENRSVCFIMSGFLLVCLQNQPRLTKVRKEKKTQVSGFLLFARETKTTGDPCETGGEGRIHLRSSSTISPLRFTDTDFEAIVTSTRPNFGPRNGFLAACPKRGRVDQIYTLDWVSFG